MSHGNQTIKEDDAELLILCELMLPTTYPRNLLSEDPTELSSSEGPQAKGLVNYGSKGSRERPLLPICVQDEPQSHLQNFRSIGPRKKGARNGSSRD